MFPHLSYDHGIACAPTWAMILALRALPAPRLFAMRVLVALAMDAAAIHTRVLNWRHRPVTPTATSAFFSRPGFGGGEGR